MKHVEKQNYANKTPSGIKTIQKLAQIAILATLLSSCDNATTKTEARVQSRFSDKSYTELKTEKFEEKHEKSGEKIEKMKSTLATKIKQEKKYFSHYLMLKDELKSAKDGGRTADIRSLESNLKKNEKDIIERIKEIDSLANDLEKTEKKQEELEITISEEGMGTKGGTKYYDEKGNLLERNFNEYIKRYELDIN